MMPTGPIRSAGERNAGGVTEGVVLNARRNGWAKALGRRLGLCALLAVGALCALTPASSLAAVTQFGSEGEAAGQFALANGIAIVQGGAEAGNVVLADTANNRVEEFTGEGVFVRTWGWGVRDGGEEFEICEAPGPCRGGNPGSGEGQFTRAGGVAVDNSAGPTQGDIYVMDLESGRVSRFGPKGEFILSFGEGSFVGLGANPISVGPTSTVYVADTGRVQRFSPAGALEAEIPLSSIGPIDDLLVDSVGDFYVVSEGVHKFDGTGTELGSVRDPGVSGSAPSLALGPGDELFVSDPVQGHIFGYDSAGAQTLSLALPEAGGVAGGLAFANGTFYVVYGEVEHPQLVRLLSVPPPGPVVVEGSEKAGPVQTTGATLEASINPEGPQDTHYHFEYGESEAYGSQTPETSLGGGEFEDQAASAVIEGLEPGSVYHFRVVAENALGEKAEGPDQTFQTLPPVSIESESASEVTADSAKLSTELNAHGLPSEYRFEYGTTTAYGNSVPEPDGQAGEGSETVGFSVTIQHLSANTTYHYRVVAHNSLGVSEGPDRTFTTQGAESVSLPDGRAWEMVSPPVKHGGTIEPIAQEGGTIQAAADGSGIAYISTSPVVEDPQGNRSLAYSELLSRRGAPGVWSTQDITTANKAPVGVVTANLSEYKLFSRDLARGAVEPLGSTPLAPRPSEPSEPDAERTPYLRNADGTFTPLVWAGNVPGGTKFGGVEIKPEEFGDGVVFETGTPDLSHVLIKSPSSLVEGFENEGFQSVYEWSEGKLAPVSVLPDGTPAPEAEVGNRNLQVRNAISADGSRAFFSLNGELFVRDMTLGVSALGVRGKTLRIDTAEAGLREGERGAVFQLASADGSRVFFKDSARLTTDSHAKQGHPDLYECEIEVTGEELGCKLHDLSVDPHANEAAGVQGAVIGAGEDGSRVYFVTTGALGEGEEAKNGECPQPSEGQCVNLYEYDTQSTAPQPRLVAVLSSEDFPDWRGESGGLSLNELTARVSPNGRYLAFMSKRSLTGFDNRDAKSGAADEEVYEFDAESGRLACASCDPTGQRPLGVFDAGVYPGLLVDAPLLWGGQTLAGSIPGWTSTDRLHALHQSRYLSDSGRLFFNSPVGLVVGDGNGTQDVYEYEPQHVGSCTLAPACLGLVSSGASSKEAAFMDASETGDDVFFLSAAQLSPADTDSALDLYDAHVCSTAPGCAAPVVGAPPPCVTSDACRAAATPQPGIFGAPASESFSGAGNLVPSAQQGTRGRAKPLARAQKLRKALAVCRRDRSRRRRVACERIVRKRYGAVRAGKMVHTNRRVK